MGSTVTLIYFKVKLLTFSPTVTVSLYKQCVGKEFVEKVQYFW